MAKTTYCRDVGQRNRPNTLLLILLWVFIECADRIPRNMSDPLGVEVGQPYRYLGEAR